MKKEVSDIEFALLLSPFSAHMLEIDGIVYPTLEHAYHSSRFAEQEIKDEILVARSPAEAHSISQRYKSGQIADFPERRFFVMKDLCRIKLEQHPEVREFLLSSEGEIVKRIYAGPAGDGIWDDGGDGSGQNMGGKIWMELRDELNSRE